MNGFAVGKQGYAGIGGLLRDHQESVLIRFSKFIGVEDSNVAELVAIRKALVLFLSSPWAFDRELIIESDSRNAAVHIFREANFDADLLAKEDVNGQTDLLVFYWRIPSARCFA
ncbi:hypothetical protein PTKIN_Ptkin18bG0047600 [Pterospermum kingtungense]